jgi:hypothetical protein
MIMPKQMYQVILPPFEYAEGQGDSRKVIRVGPEQAGKTIELDSDSPAVQSLLESAVIAPLIPPIGVETVTTPSPAGREEQLRILYQQQGFKAIQLLAEPHGLKKPETGWEAAIPLIVAAELKAAGQE